MSRRTIGFGLLAAVAALVTGCVDRRFVLESVPPGSMVYVNGQLAGPAPGDVPFIYYGTYRFEFQRDGYETLTIDECVTPPWYEIGPLEFISENLIPFDIRDVRTIRYPLQPLVLVAPEDILKRGEEIRTRGKIIGTAPCPPGTVPVPPPGAEAGPPPGIVPPVAPVPPPQ
jgi:hypothetical protein